MLGRSWPTSGERSRARAAPRSGHVSLNHHEIVSILCASGGRSSRARFMILLMFARQISLLWTPRRAVHRGPCSLTVLIPKQNLWQRCQIVACVRTLLRFNAFPRGWFAFNTHAPGRRASWLVHKLGHEGPEMRQQTRTPCGQLEHVLYCRSIPPRPSRPSLLMSSSWQLIYMRPFGSYTSSTGDTILLLPVGAELRFSAKLPRRHRPRSRPEKTRDISGRLLIF